MKWDGSFMGPELIAVETDAALPPRADVVIIGGGIAGVSTLLSLSERGISVVLVEKGRLAGEQSSRNWGFCRTQGRDLAEVPLAIESLRQWDRMSERVGGEVGFTRAGACYLCETPREVAAYEAWLDAARQWQVRSRVIGPDEVDKLLPGASRRWAGALYTDNDGRAEPQLAVPLMAQAARRLGAVIVTGCAARGYETTAGRLSGVVTERGKIACDAAVLAGGSWSRLFCGNMGIDFPQLEGRLALGDVDGTDCRARRSWQSRDLDFASFASGRMVGIPWRGGTATRPFAVVPDSCRSAAEVLRRCNPPAWHEHRLRLTGRFLRGGAGSPGHWALDATSPFEAIRMLDPLAQSGRSSRESRKNLDPGVSRRLLRCELRRRGAG